jgi:SAM-dependent MidA family methyltransferase
VSGAERVEGPPGQPLLIRELKRRIEARGPISFEEFMDVALYAEPGAYYERGTRVFGAAGDYITSAEMSGAFGETLAAQVAECLDLLEEPHPDIVELGAGRGSMASDILGFLRGSAPDLYERATYSIVERSAAMREAQAERLREHVVAGRVRWVDGPESIREGGIRGCVVANEFYDALPVRALARRDGVLMERCAGVAEDSGAFEWVEVPAEDPALTAYAERYALAPVDGTLAEAGLAARTFAGRVARAMHRGVQIVIDYGDRAPKLYDAYARPAGTLVGYHRHRVCEDPFVNVGEQDLTAHVNFSAIEDASAGEGMPALGFTTQSRFLVALGLASRIAAMAGSEEPALIRARAAMMSLLHPEGMGGIFKVLILGKGMAGAALTGLADPFAPGSSAAAGGPPPRRGSSVH